jgi:hypothetical protein
VYFYELHEGDEDVFSDVLLVHDEQWEPEEFFELVQRVRRSVQDAFEHDTLIQAIAVELERTFGFTFISDEKLTAAINVSRDDADNFLANLDAEQDEDDEDEDEFRDEDLPDYKAVIAEFDPDGGTRPN